MKYKIIRKIPKKLQVYRELSRRNYTRNNMKGYYLYEPTKGWKILVSGWYIWPHYDFIFGVPHPSNPVFDKEAGFFEIRKFTKRRYEYHGWYFDKEELKSFKKGIDSLIGRKEQIIKEGTP